MVETVSPAVQRAAEFSEWLNTRVAEASANALHDGLDPTIKRLFEAQTQVYGHLRLLTQGLEPQVTKARDREHLKLVVAGYLARLQPYLDHYQQAFTQLTEAIQPWDTTWPEHAVLAETVRLYRHGRTRLLAIAQVSEVWWEQAYRRTYSRQ